MYFTNIKCLFLLHQAWKCKVAKKAVHDDKNIVARGPAIPHALNKMYWRLHWKLIKYTILKPIIKIRDGLDTDFAR